MATAPVTLDGEVTRRLVLEVVVAGSRRDAKCPLEAQVTSRVNHNNDPHISLLHQNTVKAATGIGSQERPAGPST